ncbi:bZIP transcription factor TGA10 [Linum grandiflorum]
MAAANEVMEQNQQQNYEFQQQDGSGGAYDLGELDQALLMYLDGQNQQHHDPTVPILPHHNQQPGGGMMSSSRPPPTLNIFPSHPMYTKINNGTSTSSPPPHHHHHHGVGLVSSVVAATVPKRPSVDSSSSPSPYPAPTTAPGAPASTSQPAAKSIKREGANRKGAGASNSEHQGPKTPDPKTLRRLAQNREAARKSRLRKKAYVQQLESSRIKLSQLEQELHRARSQGMFLGGGGLLGGDQNIPLVSNISTDAAMFDMEYGRWLEEHHRLTCELRAAVDEHLPENELRLYVDNCLAHYDVVLNLKGMVAKSDVFHLVSGMWKSPAERCFMWIGGFRPSELIKIVANQIEPLTEQQIMGICGMQQSTHEAEEALSQGVEALNQSLSETIAADSLSCQPNMANYMGQMAMAINKLSTFEAFVRQTA